jgi:hypothetical protein
VIRVRIVVDRPPRFFSFEYSVRAADSVIPSMTSTACPALALSAALSGTTTHNLSPTAIKLRDRFRDLVGFKRCIIHELGHAVVASCIGHQLVSVTIDPNGDLAGACMYMFDRQEVDSNTFRLRRAVVASAGRVAVVKAIAAHDLNEMEFACSIDSHHEEYGHDERTLSSLAQRFNVAYGPWVRKVSEDAWNILDAPEVWNALMKLARELKHERTLAGGRVRQVLRECVAVG